MNEPHLVSTIWGGNKIIAFKHLDVKQEKVGTSVRANELYLKAL